MHELIAVHVHVMPSTFASVVSNYMYTISSFNASTQRNYTSIQTHVPIVHTPTHRLVVAVVTVAQFSAGR